MFRKGQQKLESNTNYPIVFLPVNERVHHGVDEGEQFGYLGEVHKRHTHFEL